MKTTAKELKAEIRTVSALSKDDALKKICEILLDIVAALEQKDEIGFKS